MADKKYDVEIHVKMKENVRAEGKKVEAGLAGVEKQTKKAKNAFDQMGGGAKNAFSEMAAGARSKMSGLGEVLRRPFIAAAYTVGQYKHKATEAITTLKQHWLEFAAAAYSAYKVFDAAKKYQNEQLAFADTFGAKTEEMEKAVARLSQTTNYSMREIKATYVTTYDSMERYGLIGEKYHGLVARSADLAASKGRDLSDVMERVANAMRGEAEASEPLGLSLNDNYMKMTAFGGALKDVWEKLQDNEKAHLRYLEYLDQTEKYTGKASERADTLAGAQARFGKVLNDVIVPALSLTLTKIMDAAEWYGRFIAKTATLLGGLRQSAQDLFKGKFTFDDLVERMRITEELEVREKELTRTVVEGAAEQKTNIKAMVDAYKARIEKENKAKDAAQASAKAAQESAQAWYGYTQVLSDGAEITGAWIARQEQAEAVFDRQVRQINNEYIEALEAAGQSWEDLYQQALTESESFGEGISLGWEKYRRETKSAAEYGAEAFSDAVTSMEQIFGDVLYAGITGDLDGIQDAFKYFGQNMLRSWTGTLGQMATQTVLTGGGSLFGGTAPAGTGEAAQGATGMLGGSLMSGLLGKTIGFGGGSAAAVSMPLWAPLLAGGGVAAALYQIPVIRDFVKGGHETSGKGELQTWERYLQGAGLEKAERGRWGGLERDTFNIMEGHEAIEAYAPLLEDAAEMAKYFREELGFASAHAEEMASVLLYSFADAEMTLGQAAARLREMQLGLIATGEAGYEAYESVRELTQTMTDTSWLEGLQSELMDYMVSGEEMTAAQFERMQEWLSQVDEALAGDTGALSALQDRFGADALGLTEMNEALTSQQTIWDEASASVEAYRQKLEYFREFADVSGLGSDAGALQTQIAELSRQRQDALWYAGVSGRGSERQAGYAATAQDLAAEIAELESRYTRQAEIYESARSVEAELTAGLTASETAAAGAEAEVARLNTEIEKLAAMGPIKSQIELELSVTPKINADDPELAAGVMGLVTGAIGNNTDGSLDYIKDLIKKTVAET